MMQALILCLWILSLCSIHKHKIKGMRFLVPGGILITDNVLQDGDIIESRFAVERRDRTIHSRMREYLYTLKHHPELETSILPLGDGVALSVRK